MLAVKDQPEPRPGDFTFCCYCHALLRYKPEGPDFATPADVSQMDCGLAKHVLAVMASRQLPPAARQ